MKNALFIFFISFAGLCHGQLTTIEFKLDTLNTEETHLEVFKFYISNIEIQFEEGSAFIEQNSYHLIDLEDEATRKLELQNVQEKRIEKLKFTVGTDSATNVSGALDGDLDPIKGMYWAWNSGYVNFKVEGKYENQPFEYHIGGYMSPNATARNIEIDVINSISETLVLHVDVMSFLARIDIAQMNSVLIPGATASELADSFSTIFSIHE